MAGKAAAANSLITSRAPDTTLSVQLHPLVLLTISDYITRHISRQQPGPMIGAIIGQQNGRTFTLEHAYECKLAEKSNTMAVDEVWFADRLQQYKDVHKVPALDLVALFTMSPTAGPSLGHAAVQPPSFSSCQRWCKAQDTHRCRLQSGRTGSASTGT